MAAVSLLLAGAVAVAGPASAQTCRQRLLQELGWQFDPAEAGVVEVRPGTPCDRADLAEARAAGDLLVRVPHDLDRPAREQLEDGLLQHPATLCAYGFALGAATRRAVDQLVANRGYRFSALQMGWIGFGPTGPARDGWQPTASFGRGYQPLGANSRAIQAFYTGHVRSECGVGRQVAQYATQAELYGMAAFDTAFDADEIVIGTFKRLHPTRSILLGTSAGRFTRDGRAIIAAKSGRQAFMGLPGFIFHVFDRSALDDIHNQAENFVVYDVSPQAAVALRHHRGFEHYNERSRTIWWLARSLEGRKPRRYFERLLHERDPALRAALSPEAQATVARLDAQLSNPFYQGFEIYVHKLGVKPVGFHIVRQLDRNPRTPFRIELGLHNLHTTLYERYLEHRIAECDRARLQASNTAPGPG